MKTAIVAFIIGVLVGEFRSELWIFAKSAWARVRGR